MWSVCRDWGLWRGPGLGLEYAQAVGTQHGATAAMQDAAMCLRMQCGAQRWASTSRHNRRDRHKDPERQIRKPPLRRAICTDSPACGSCRRPRKNASARGERGREERYIKRTKIEREKERAKNERAGKSEKLESGKKGKGNRNHCAKTQNTSLFFIFSMGGPEKLCTSMDWKSCVSPAPGREKTGTLPTHTREHAFTRYRETHFATHGRIHEGTSQNRALA